MGARIEEYDNDTVIMKEGAVAEKRMYIILEGKVVLYRNYGTDDEYLIGICSKGNTFGEMNMFSDSPAIFTAVAYGYVKLAWVEKNNLESFLHGYPENAIQIIEKLAKSYVFLEKNLQLAINEISVLRDSAGIEAGEAGEDGETGNTYSTGDAGDTGIDVEEIRNELAKLTAHSGEVRYINK